MQKQPNKKTVQGSLEEALNKLNINTNVLHAGRTDRGVHALNQVISFQVPSFRDKEKLLPTLNKILHPFIHIKKFFVVNDNFNPRFDAKKRSYRYIITPHFTPYLANSTFSIPGINCNILFCSPHFKCVWNPTILYKLALALSCLNCTTAYGVFPF